MPIAGYSYLYEISNMGRVKSLEKSVYYKLTDCHQFFPTRIIPPKCISGGYMGVRLFKKAYLRISLFTEWLRRRLSLIPAIIHRLITY